MPAQTWALPLTPAERDTLPGLVARLCDIEGSIHEETGWQLTRPLLMIQGLAPDESMILPLSVCEEDLPHHLHRMAELNRKNPPRWPVEAIALVLMVNVVIDKGDNVDMKVVVGVLRNGDLLTIHRMTDAHSELMWLPDPHEIRITAQPYVDALTNLVESTPARPQL